MDGKRGKRVVDFTEATAAAMRDWLSARPRVDDDHVFLSRTGKPLTSSGLYQIFKRLAESAGVTGRYNPQSVRHLVGQLFVDQANLELARAKLDHSTVVTTSRFYAHQDRERVKAATRRLSILNNPPNSGAEE